MITHPRCFIHNKRSGVVFIVLSESLISRRAGLRLFFFCCLPMCLSVIALNSSIKFKIQILMNLITDKFKIRVIGV